MHKPVKWRALAGVAAMGAAGGLFAWPLQAQEADAVEQTAAPSDSASGGESRWFARVGVIGALYESHATFASDGQTIPGASAHARDNITGIFDIGYDVTKDFAVVMMSGIPPRTAVEGRGTVESLGMLGAVRYGPVFLTGLYRLPQWGHFRPYVGAGFAHAFILKNYDGSVTDLKVHDNSGFALQAGFEYRWSERWGLFADYKRLWLALDADGLIETAPVTARVTLNPNLISAGVRYQF
jgi:outer membrane protein